MASKKVERVEAEEVESGGMGASSSLPAVIGNYKVMKTEISDLSAIMRANIGEKLEVFDLDRIRVPAGGSLTWEIPTLTGEEEAKTVEGVVIAFSDRRAFWRESFDATGGGTPPDCSSDDCIVGVGDPGGTCATCALAKFGSARDGEGDGQACKQVRLLFLVRPADLLPIVVAVPPSSLKNVRRHFLRLASQSMPYYGVVWSFELAKDKSKGGITYSKIVPKLKAVLPPEEAARMKAYSDAFAPSVARITIDAKDVSADA
jgi:hypothetical protein